MLLFHRIFFVAYILVIPFIRAVHFIYLNFRLRLRSRKYNEAFEKILNQILENKLLLNEIADRIDPIAGLGVEDIWLMRIYGNTFPDGSEEVKPNHSLNEIIDLPAMASMIEQTASDLGLKKSVLKVHLKRILVEMWNGKKRRKKYSLNTQYLAAELVRSLKSLMKSKLKSSDNKESIESLCYNSGKVFYKRYSYNLYKKFFLLYLLSSLILSPSLITFLFFLCFPFIIALNIYRQMQPYPTSLQEIIDDLNKSDSNGPLNLSDFKSEINAPQDADRTSDMTLNKKYFRDKIGRVKFYLVLMLLIWSLYFFIFFSFLSGNGNSADLSYYLAVFGIVFLIFTINYIWLLKKLLQLRPEYVIKKSIELKNLHDA